LSKDQRETLQIMTDSSQRLIHMISTLLDLSKIEAGMMEYRIALTDLKRLAESSVNKIRLLAERKHVQIVVEAPSRPLWVPADGARIEQVLDNLLSNALKFSPNGAPVNLLLESDPQARVVHVSVADRGPGISPEDLPHIFERFYQGRVQEKTSVAGSGLGLALAKKVVEAHGGRIWAQSETGKGTTIHFLLPLTQPGVSP
jgi:two-component system sensor histidine kinase GlrK